jgi:leucyl aminopeptidase
MTFTCRIQDEKDDYFCFMIRIQTYDKVPKIGFHVVLLGRQGSRDNKLPQKWAAFASKVQEGKESIDFMKNHEEMVFFVKSKQTDEALRKSGAQIIEQLPMMTEQIVVHGNVKKIYSLLEGLMLSSYQFLGCFSKPGKHDRALKDLLVPSSMSAKEIRELEAINKAVSWARDRVNEPVSHLNAVQLALSLQALANDAPLLVQTLEKTQIESLKMGGLLAVNRGSIDPPTFTILEYKPTKPINKKPVVLVGKGVVYDTGGLSLKPTPGSMDSMKCDMAGAACVAGAIYLAAMQELNVHVIALIPATDNRPGMQAYTPGDVVTMFDGTTIEVLNTDAEGRMILADALSYANKFNPSLVIDAATLTGAAVRAIGTGAAVVMGNAPDYHFEALQKCGEVTHERVVRFPFWDDYRDTLKSTIADMKNIGGPDAGMITAGKFLEHFVKAPYIHMDIAGPAWMDKKDSYRGQGGTGMGVRLLYHFLKNFK